MNDNIFMEFDINLINQFVFDLIYIYFTLSRLEFTFFKSISPTLTYLKILLMNHQIEYFDLYPPGSQKFSKKRGVS